MRVILNSPGFSYDVHSLVKAFYPEEDVTIIQPGEAEADISISISPEEVPDKVKVSGRISVSANIAQRSKELSESFEDITRPRVKNRLKRLLYDVLADITGISLPWGTMTGIRPTKVPMKMIVEGADDGAIAEYMKSVYLCSDEKIKLATDIAHTETAITQSLSENGFSLYIGIPFCPTTCMYCSFTSYPIVKWKDAVDDYLDALTTELDLIAQIFSGRAVDSVYIGGGTPTTLTAGQLSRLIESIGKRFDTSHLLELTVEAGRPDSITKEKLTALSQAGVTRISVNPQTMNEKTLKLIGRRHSVDDFFRAFDMARDAGFTNINTDLILGLPGEDEEDVRYTFDRIKDIAPDSLTVHCMAIKRAAHMHEFLLEHKDVQAKVTDDMLGIAQHCAAQLNMKPYYLYRQKNISGNFENVGYARRGCYGIYNTVMMEEVSDIAAAGAGTISKRIYKDGRIERCDNVKDVALYIDRIGEMTDRKKKLFE